MGLDQSNRPKSPSLSTSEQKNNGPCLLSFTKDDWPVNDATSKSLLYPNNESKLYECVRYIGGFNPVRTD